jgi:hypothetical protein
MSELKFFLLTRILTQNFNSVDIVKFLEKNKKIHIQTLEVTLKMASCTTMIIKKRKLKKVENQDSMGKNNFFLSTLPFRPWAVLATWLDVGAPQKIQEK